VEIDVYLEHGYAMEIMIVEIILMNKIVVCDVFVLVCLKFLCGFSSENLFEYAISM